MRKGKLPQYIVNAIRRRAAAAEKYFIADYQISEYCKSHGINSEYVNGHVETIVNFDPNIFIRDLEEILERKSNA